MSGLSQVDRLRALAGQLSPRDHAIVTDVVRLQFVTAGQLSRLHFSEIEHVGTRMRRVQRTTARLVEQGLLRRLERRVGGTRAGSASYTYATTAEGERLVRYLAGEGIPRLRNYREPGLTFVVHAIACAEVYVQLVEAARGGLELIDYEAEPDCWRTFLGPLGEAISLRPDAFASVGFGEFEFRSFVEVDRGTEGSSALTRKLASYIDYWRSGVEQRQHVVFPRVVWQVETARRAELLERLVAGLPEGTQQLFAVTTAEHMVAILSGRDGNGGRP